MKNLLKYISFSVVVLMMTSCVVVNRHTHLLQERASLPYYEDAPFQEYRLQIDDQVRILVLSLNEDITRLFNIGQGGGGAQNQGTVSRIFQDGTIDIPFADSIPIVGLTIQEATAVIEERLRPFGDDVTVRLVLENNHFYIFGASGRGRVALTKDRMTIFQALAEAGFSPGRGNLQNVKVIRKVNNVSEIIEFDLRPRSLIHSEFYYVQPNDIIYIATARGSFFRLESFTALTGFITSSLAFLLFMISNANRF